MPAIQYATAQLGVSELDIDGVSLTNQNYVYNWTRDSAMAAMEVALSSKAAGDQAAGDRRGAGPVARRCAGDSA